jgi:hypothetical protein
VGRDVRDHDALPGGERLIRDQGSGIGDQGSGRA